MNEVSYGAPQADAARDLSATLAAHGTSPAATEGQARDFLTRVQRDIDEQVDLRVQQRLGQWQPPKTTARRGMDPATDLPLALASLFFATGVTIAKATDLGTVGVIVVWAAVVLVNAVWSWRS